MTEEIESKEVSVPPNEKTRVRLMMQQADRWLMAVQINGGGDCSLDDVHFEQIEVGNIVWDNKPCSWPIAVFLTVYLINSSKSEKTVKVEAIHWSKNQVTMHKRAREGSPADVVHTIRIRIRRDGTVDGDLDESTPIHPRTRLTIDGPPLTVDGQVLNIVEQACVAIIVKDIGGQGGQGSQGSQGSQG